MFTKYFIFNRPFKLIISKVKRMKLQNVKLGNIVSNLKQRVTKIFFNLFFFNLKELYKIVGVTHLFVFLFFE